MGHLSQQLQSVIRCFASQPWVFGSQVLGWEHVLRCSSQRSRNYIHIYAGYYKTVELYIAAVQSLTTLCSKMRTAGAKYFTIGGDFQIEVQPNIAERCEAYIWICYDYHQWELKLTFRIHWQKLMHTVFGRRRVPSTSERRTPGKYRRHWSIVRTSALSRWTCWRYRAIVEGSTKPQNARRCQQVTSKSPKKQI